MAGMAGAVRLVAAGLLCLPVAAGKIPYATETFYGTTEGVTVSPAGTFFVKQARVPWVKASGPLAVKSVQVDLVDHETLKPVPLDQAYMHHWIVSGHWVDPQNHTHTQPIGSFGAGSEFRNLPEELAESFAMVTPGNEVWIAQYHIIDLRLANADEQTPCLECRRRMSCDDGFCLNATLGPGGRYYPTSTKRFYDQYPGGFEVCNWGSESDFFPPIRTAANNGCSAHPAPGPVRSYRLKYTVSYSRDVDRFTPVHGVIIQAEAPYAEYQVPSCDGLGASVGGAACVHTLASEWLYQRGVLSCTSCPAFDPQVTLPLGPNDTYQILPFTGAMGLVWATGHQHKGALGLELWLQRPGASYDMIFDSKPVYGTEVGVPGNERGFVVGNGILKLEEPLPIPEGSRLRVVSKYEARSPAYNLTTFAAGREVAHTGVMGYMRLRVVALEKERAENRRAARLSSQTADHMTSMLAARATAMARSQLPAVMV